MDQECQDPIKALIIIILSMNNVDSTSSSLSLSPPWQGCPPEPHVAQPGNPPRRAERGSRRPVVVLLEDARHVVVVLLEDAEHVVVVVVVVRRC